MSGPHHPEGSREAPRGALVVVVILTLSILSLWMLALGVLQGRA